MEYTEKAKEKIRESLIDSFIDKKSVVDREMRLLNLLIGSFTGNVYTYDEYCNCRMNFEMEACDKVLDVDVDEEMKMTNQEKVIIQNRAMRKTMENPEVDFEELMEEEFVNWQLDKCQRIDKKMFYQISKYSSVKLLQEKIPTDLWNSKKGYFEDICEAKAQKYGEAVAAANKDKHEQDIRSSMI
jgi:hypothetical protein